MGKNGCEIEYIMYSRNSKRRYGLYKSKNPDRLHLFFKYLKGLRSKVKPIFVDLSEFQMIPGCWNGKHILKGKQKLYLFATKPTTEPPKFNYFKLEEDPIIKQYEKWISLDDSEEEEEENMCPSKTKFIKKKSQKQHRPYMYESSQKNLQNGISCEAPVII